MVSDFWSGLNSHALYNWLYIAISSNYSIITSTHPHNNTLCARTAFSPYLNSRIAKLLPILIGQIPNRKMEVKTCGMNRAIAYRDMR